MTCTTLDAASWTSSVAHWRLFTLLDPVKSYIRLRWHVWATMNER